MSSLKITGTDALIKSLKKSANLNDIKNIVKMNGAELQKNAQRKASVDTGFMKRSIVLTFEDGGMTAKIASMAEYSAYVNYGTRFQTANPFMTNSFNVQKPIFLSDLSKVLK